MTNKELPPAETVIDNATIVDNMPSLIGAIDQTLVDMCGERQPFVVVVFANGMGIHGTNMIPAADAMVALKALALQ